MQVALDGEVMAGEALVGEALVSSEHRDKG